MTSSSQTKCLKQALGGVRFSALSGAGPIGARPEHFRESLKARKRKRGCARGRSLAGARRRTPARADARLQPRARPLIFNNVLAGFGIILDMVEIAAGRGRGGHSHSTRWFEIEFAHARSSTDFAPLLCGKMYLATLRERAPGFSQRGGSNKVDTILFLGAPTKSWVIYPPVWGRSAAEGMAP